MLRKRGLDNKINHLHEKSLRTSYKDELSDFETMLEKDNSVKTHVKKLQLIMIEIF